MRQVIIKYKGSTYPPPFLTVLQHNGKIEEERFVSPRKVQVFEYYTLPRIVWRKES